MGRRDKEDRVSSDDVDYERSKERKKKKRKEDRRRRSDDEDTDQDDDGKRRRRREKDRGRDRDKDKDHRSRDHRPSLDNDSSSSSDSASVTDNDDNGANDKKRKHDKKRPKKDDKKQKKSSHKKDKKKDKKNKRKHHDRETAAAKDGDDRRKKRKKSRSEEEDQEDSDSQPAKAAMKALERNYQLADALHDLLLYHPTVMATDTLPLLLIQLGGGTTLDLRQMTDQHAAQGLEAVLKCLSPYGVVQENHAWRWKSPAVGPKAHKDERILLRIVRTLLNDIGLTCDAAQKYEQQEHERAEAAANAPIEQASSTDDNHDSSKEPPGKDIQQKTLTLLQGFQNQNNNNSSNDATPPSTLPGELGGLCNMIMEGETISLEGLPDAKLRENLEHLFQACGLEPCEMEDSDDDEDDDDDDDDDDDHDDDKKKAAVSMGYGLPENSQVQEHVKATLASVMEACKQAASLPNKRAVKGPMPMPSNYVAPEESSDDEGPAPVGVAQKRGPSMPKELVKQQAEMRARQLKGAVTGQEELMSATNEREEWMLVPGKFDFLSSIKAGNPQRSRGFQAKSKVEEESSSRVLDPNVKAEMDAIMQAHSDARGPSLVEQHRMKKEQVRQEQAASGKGNKGDWNWSRDKDLDAGRKVDTNALHQVLGGAVSDLKKKFQGGF